MSNPKLKKRTDLRNVAIIAHVDHGKTTLVDQMMRQSGLFRASELDRLVGGQHGLILDSNDLERERGITILAKNIALQVGGTKINIIDTPGHADFGGEVERVLKMADGALLLVDAAEGPLPQTRFVLRKAFECGLRPIVVINKIDRPDARPAEVLNAVFDLFVELDADDATLDFPTIYASGRRGHRHDRPGRARRRTCSRCSTRSSSTCRRRRSMPDAPLQMLVVTLDYSDYVGRIAIGRVVAGKIRKGQRDRPAQARRPAHRRHGRSSSTSSTAWAGSETDEVAAGDICAVVGLESVDIGDTIADFDNAVALPPITVDEPTLEMIFRINDSPFAGQEGQYVTSRQLRDRLMKELESNVALRVAPGRGEARRVPRLRPRPAAPGHPAREHAPRGLRAVGRQAARHHQGGQRQDAWSRSSTWWSMCRRRSVGPVMELVGNRRGECVKMETRGRADAHRVHDPGPRPDRPAHPADERDERPGDHAPQLLRLPAGARQHPGTAQRRHGLDRDRPGHAVRPGQPAGSRHPVHRRRRAGLRRARSSASTAATTTCRSTSAARRS